MEILISILSKISSLFLVFASTMKNNPLSKAFYIFGKEFLRVYGSVKVKAFSSSKICFNDSPWEFLFVLVRKGTRVSSITI